MTKRDIIAAMLSNYHEAQALNGPSDIPGTGDHLPLMPPTWNDSYRELERCLKLLRQHCPTHYKHLRARYSDTITKRGDIEIRNGRPKLPPHTELLALAPTSRRYANATYRQWPAWVRAERVRRGIDFIAAAYQGEPFLPAELRTRVAA